MAIQTGGTAPYAPTATVVEVIGRYRERGLTTPFTAEVLERAGVPESLSRRTLASLKLLGLVDADGSPTPEFEQAVRSPDQEFTEKLRDILTETYAEALSFADPKTDPYDRVRDAFRGYNPRGQIDRAVMLFLGLMEFVGVDTAAASKSSRASAGSRAEPSGNGGNRLAKRAPNLVARAAKVAPKQRLDEGAAELIEDQLLPPGLLGLLRQIPSSGAGWTPTRRDEFIAAFIAVLNFTVPVIDFRPDAHSGRVQGRQEGLS